MEAEASGHDTTINRLAGLPAGSFAAEQYRILGSQLERRQNGAGGVVAVTSPAAGDGKTTTALNLALALAQPRAGRILLVDADLRRRSLCRRLKLTGEAAGPGLAGAAADPSLHLESLVRARPPLAVLPAGEPGQPPSELLRSPRVGALLESARTSRDLVILDTPPLLLVPDCHVLARWVDGFLIVVAAHETPRKLLEEALNTLSADKVLGIVLNNDDRPLGGYYRRYQGYYGPSAGRFKPPPRRPPSRETGAKERLAKSWR